MPISDGQGVAVVGGADGHGVDVPGHLVVHLAEVVELLGRRELLGLLVERPLVDVAEGDDLAELARLVDVAAPLAADADAGELQRLVRLPAGPLGRGGRGGEEVAEARGAGPQEGPTVQIRIHQSALQRRVDEVTTILENSWNAGPATTPYRPPAPAIGPDPGRVRPALCPLPAERDGTIRPGS